MSRGLGDVYKRQILYNGITRFNAVSPSAPFAIDIKYESART